MTWVRACIGLGSNIGDGVRTLQGALAEMGAWSTVRIAAVSRFYRSPAWGVTDQADFVNAAAAVETGLSAPALLEQLLLLERRFGRERGDGGSRWGPRTLDLDLLLFDDRIIVSPGLRVPHPRLHERAFALVPLLDVMPDATIPGIGQASDSLAGVAADAIALRPIDALP